MTPAQKAAFAQRMAMARANKNGTTHPVAPKVAVGKCARCKKPFTGGYHSC